MKPFNKALSVLLCLVLALSCFGLAAFAEDPETTECEHSYIVSTIVPTCVNEGYQLHVCTKCGDTFMDNKVPARGHSYGEWTVVREASCTEEGLRERECVLCHGKDTKTISVLPHVDEDENGECDVCGAEMEVKQIFSPFEWLKSFIRFLRELINSIFA